MDFQQEIKLINAGKTGVCLVRVTTDEVGRLIRYESLDVTPILPSSPWYEEYVRARDRQKDIANVIRSLF